MPCKRRPTLSVINILRGRKLLTTLDTPPVMQSLAHCIISVHILHFKGAHVTPLTAVNFYAGLVLANVHHRTKFEVCTLYHCRVI